MPNYTNEMLEVELWYLFICMIQVSMLQANTIETNTRLPKPGWFTSWRVLDSNTRSSFNICILCNVKVLLWNNYASHKDDLIFTANWKCWILQISLAFRPWSLARRCAHSRVRQCWRHRSFRLDFSLHKKVY